MSELDSIEYYTGVIRGRLVDIERNAGDQHEKVKKLQAERDELKRQVKVWERLAVKVEQEDWEHAEQLATAVPRVITADELKAGQKLAIESVGGVGDVFTVQSVGTSWEGYPAAYKTGGSFWGITEDERIWLLEDAPAEEPEPVKVGDTINTEEELEKLPRLTILRDEYGNAFEKSAVKWWITGSDCLFPSSELIKFRPFTVLHLPEEAVISWRRQNMPYSIKDQASQSRGLFREEKEAA